MTTRTHADLTPVTGELKTALHSLRSLHAGEREGAAIEEVWRTVQRVCASALVEHWRLLGLDVTRQEARLEARGSAPWRDLIVSSSDSETEALTAPDEPNKRVEAAVEPQLHLLQESSHLYVVIPLAPLNSLTTHQGDQS